MTQARFAHSIGHCARGVVMIEFVIAFVPVFLLFLGIVQLALLSAASLIVQHAAVAGARAASVVLDDDPRYYGTPRGDISDHRGVADDAFDRALAERLSIGGAVELPASAPLGGPRMAAIRRAVHAPLCAIALEPLLFAKLVLPFTRVSVGDGLGHIPSTRLLFGLGYYLAITTAVVFPRAPGSKRLFQGRVAVDGSVTVRVTHLFACTVPAVSALMCRHLRWDGERGGLSSVRDPDRSTRAALSELKQAPSAGQQSIFALGQVPVAVLQAEATLPAQSAPYRYLSERRQKARR
jgi:hypothetical protein